MSNKPSRYRRKMRVETLTMPVDPNDVHRFRSEQNRLVAAAAALDRVKVGHAKPDAIAEAETELADAQKALDAKLVELGVPTMTFTFQALSPAKLEALLADHPPSKDQIDAARRADPDGPLPDYNGITYPPALLAATCTRVEWSDGGVHEGRDGRQGDVPAGEAGRVRPTCCIPEVRWTGRTLAGCRPRAR
jgi:hypothetical protein